MGFPGGSVVKNSSSSTGDTGDMSSIPGQEGPLEEEMASHFSILAWKILWIEGAWWATVHGVAKNWTRLSMHLIYTNR